MTTERDEAVRAAVDKMRGKKNLWRCDLVGDQISVDRMTEIVSAAYDALRDGDAKQPEALKPSALGEAVATVAFRGERYAHDTKMEVQLSKSPGVDFPIGTKFYLHPTTPAAEPSSEGVTDEMVEALFRVLDDPHNQWHTRKERGKAGIEAALATKPAKGGEG